MILISQKTNALVSWPASATDVLLVLLDKPSTTPTIACTPRSYSSMSQSSNLWVADAPDPAVVGRVSSRVS